MVKKVWLTSDMVGQIEDSLGTKWPSVVDALRLVSDWRAYRGLLAQCVGGEPPLDDIRYVLSQTEGKTKGKETDMPEETPEERERSEQEFRDKITESLPELLRDTIASLVGVLVVLDSASVKPSLEASLILAVVQGVLVLLSAEYARLKPEAGLDPDLDRSLRELLDKEG